MTPRMDHALTASRDEYERYPPWIIGNIRADFGGAAVKPSAEWIHHRFIITLPDVTVEKKFIATVQAGQVLGLGVVTSLSFDNIVTHASAGKAQVNFDLQFDGGPSSRLNTIYIGLFIPT